MLDSKYLRENFEKVRERLKTRGEVPGLERFTELDLEMRKVRHEAETLKNRRNTVSEEIGRLRKEGIAMEALEVKASEMKGASLFPQIKSKIVQIFFSAKNTSYP